MAYTAAQIASYVKNGQMVTNLSIGLVQGQDRQVYAQWKHSKSGQTESYDLDWEFWDGSRLPQTAAQKKKNQAGSLRWLPGSHPTVPKSDAEISGGWFRNIWTAPSEALAVRVKIWPKSKTHNVKSGKKTKSVAYYSGKATNFVTHSFSNDKVLTPAVSVENDDGAMKITVTCNDQDCNFADVYVQEKPGSGYNNVKKFLDNVCPQSLEFVAFEKGKVPVGRKLYVTARCKTNKSTKTASDWSTRAEFTAIPAKPTGIKAAATGSDSAKVTWNSAAGASTYECEYVKDDPAYFNSNPGEVSSQGDIHGESFTPTGLETGHTWYFRVRGVNSDDDTGAWSDHASTVLATKPDAPTTYETDPAYMVGDEAYLRWMHNSEDQSEQTAYQIEVNVIDASGATVEGSKTLDNVPVYPDGTFFLPSDFSSFGMQPSSAAVQWFSNSSLVATQVVASCEVVNYNGHLTVTVPIDMTDITAGIAWGLKYVPTHESQYISGTTDDSYTLDLTGISDGVEICWKVRTKGAHNDWSPWSVMRSFHVYEQPALSLILEDSEGAGVDDENPLTSIPLVATMDASGGGGQVVGYHLSISLSEDMGYVGMDGVPFTLAAGSSIYSADYLDATDPYSAQVNRLYNGGTYVAVADVSFASGLRATSDPIEFTTDFDVTIPEPNAGVVFDPDTLSADIYPACYEVDQDGEATETLADGVLLAVYRINANGTLTLLRDGIENDGYAMVTDPHATFGECWYHIAAYDESTGVGNYADAMDESDHGTCCITWDEMWQQGYPGEEEGNNDWTNAGWKMDGLYNLQYSEAGDVEAEDIQYIGRRDPVSYYGTQRGYTASYQMEFPRYDTTTLELARRLQDLADDCYIREPSGTGFWAHVKVRLDRSYDSGAYRITVDATRVDRTDSALEA